jgi:hypothetical protein
MSAIADLRRMIEARYPNAVPLPERTVPQVPTGVEPLDRNLPAGGLPRGRLTVWNPSVGGSAVLRAACIGAVERGERAAWIDGLGRASPDVDWGGVVLARPRDERQALECTEELLRSGGFSVVARVGGTDNGTERLRLCRAAREGGAALVEISADPHLAAVRISARTGPESFHWCFNDLGEPIEIDSVSLRVRVMAAGWNRETNVVLMVSDHEHSLSLEPGLADRRGVAREPRLADPGRSPQGRTGKPRSRMGRWQRTAG